MVHFLAKEDNPSSIGDHTKYARIVQKCFGTGNMYNKKLLMHKDE